MSTSDFPEKSSSEYNDYIIHDVLGHIDGVTSRKMFGGYGLYLPDEEHGKVMFGGIIEDQMFVRSDDEHSDYIVGEGGEQFIYHGHKVNSEGRENTLGYKTHKKPTAMPWYFVPEHILEDREKMDHLVSEGFDIAKANKKPKKITQKK